MILVEEEEAIGRSDTSVRSAAADDPTVRRPAMSDASTDSDGSGSKVELSGPATVWRPRVMIVDLGRANLFGHDKQHKYMPLKEMDRLDDLLFAAS